MTRPRDAESTRRDLLKAAQRRFSLLGYDRTTTRDVAADVGVNLTLINRYFGSKQGLFEAVLAAAPALIEESSAERASGDVIDAFIDGLDPDAYPEFGNRHPMMLLLRESSADEGTRELRALALDSAVKGLLESSGRDTGRAGSARRRDAELRAQLVLALFSGVIALRTASGLEPLASVDPEELRPALQDAVDALLGRRTS